MKQVRIHDKQNDIIEFWKDQGIVKNKTEFVNDAIEEYNKYLQMVLKPSDNPDYDEFIAERNGVGK